MINHVMCLLNCGNEEELNAQCYLVMCSDWISKEIIGVCNLCSHAVEGEPKYISWINLKRWVLSEGQPEGCETFSNETHRVLLYLKFKGQLMWSELAEILFWKKRFILDIFWKFIHFHLNLQFHFSLVVSSLRIPSSFKNILEKRPRKSWLKRWQIRKIACRKVKVVWWCLGKNKGFKNPKNLDFVDAHTLCRSSSGTGCPLSDAGCCAKVIPKCLRENAGCSHAHGAASSALDFDLIPTRWRIWIAQENRTIGSAARWRHASRWTHGDGWTWTVTTDAYTQACCAG